MQGHQAQSCSHLATTNLKQALRDQLGKRHNQSLAVQAEQGSTAETKPTHTASAGAQSKSNPNQESIKGSN